MAFYRHSVLTPTGHPIALPLGPHQYDLMDPYNVVARYVHSDFTCGSLRYAMAGNRLLGPFAANVLASAIVGGRRLGQFEEARTNDFTYNRQLNHANWTKVRCPITANAGVAPNGKTEADLLVPTTDDNSHFVEQYKSFDGSSSYALSGFAKSAGNTCCQLYMNGGGFPGGQSPLAYFDLDAGTVLSSSDVDSVGIILLANGWCFIYITATSDTATGTLGNRITVTDGTDDTFAGNASDGILAWNMQREIGAFPSSPIESLASPVTRLKTEAFFPAAVVPSMIHSAPHSVIIIPYWASTAPTSTAVVYRLWQDASNFISLRAVTDGSATAFHLRVRIAGSPSNYVTTSSIGHSAHQPMTLIMDPAAGTIEVQNATSGNGVYSGTPWAGLMDSNSILYYGSDSNYASHLNGHIVEPYKKAA